MSFGRRILLCHLINGMDIISKNNECRSFWLGFVSFNLLGDRIIRTTWEYDVDLIYCFLIKMIRIHHKKKERLNASFVRFRWLILA